MIGINVGKYTTNITKKEVESFCEITIKEKEWEVILEIINYIEQYISINRKNILSKATIELNLNDNSFKEINFSDLFYPITELNLSEKNKIIYISKNNYYNFGLKLIILISIKNIIFEATKDQDYFKKFFKKINNLIYTSFSQNFQIIKLDNMFNESEIEEMKKQYNLSKEQLMIYIDGISYLLQEQIFPNYYGINIGRIQLIDINLNIEQIINYIKKQIKKGKLPGPFIEIIKIEKNNIQNVNIENIYFSFGESTHNNDLKFKIKSILEVLIYNLNLDTLINQIGGYNE